MSADLRSAVIDIGIVLKSAAGRGPPYRFQSGRAGMSSRAVATVIPTPIGARIGRLYRFRAAAPALSLWIRGCQISRSDSGRDYTACGRVGPLDGAQAGRRSTA